MSEDQMLDISEQLKLVPKEYEATAFMDNVVISDTNGNPLININIYNLINYAKRNVL